MAAIAFCTRAANASAPSSSRWLSSALIRISSLSTRTSKVEVTTKRSRQVSCLELGVRGASLREVSHTDVSGSLVVVGAARTIAILRQAFASLVLQYGIDDLDAAAIRLSVPRAFTQQLSSYFEAQIDDNGRAFAGIYFLSKHGDDIENWAIFEQERMKGQTPILSVERENPDPNDDDLRRALDLLAIRIE